MMERCVCSAIETKGRGQVRKGAARGLLLGLPNTVAGRQTIEVINEESVRSDKGLFFCIRKDQERMKC